MKEERRILFGETCLRFGLAFLIIGWIFVPPIGRRSRYGYYKLFVSEDAKDNLMKRALIARKAVCDTPENHH